MARLILCFSILMSSSAHGYEAYKAYEGYKAYGGYRSLLDEEDPVNDEMADCGLKPRPEPGCFISDCVNGEWQQYCRAISCGARPIPEAGCRIRGCINGEWKQVCY